MKIAVFSRVIPAHGGGGMQRVVWDYAQEWTKLGHEVTVYTTSFDRSKIDPEDKVAVVSLGGKAGRYSPNWWLKSAQIAKTLDVDVIMGAGTGAHAIAAALSSSKCVVMQAHGTSLDELKTKLKVRNARALISAPLQVMRLLQDFAVYRKYASVIAIGHSVQETISQYPKLLQPWRVDLIENGVQIQQTITQQEVAEAREHYGLPTDAHIALCIGRLHKEKGFDRAIDALNTWGGFLLIAGDGPHANELKQLAKNSGVESRVKFLGHIDKGETRRAFAASNFMISLPRRREGLPMTLLESLSFGRPVVAGSQLKRCFEGSAPDGITFVDESNCESVAAACAKAANDENVIELPERYDSNYVIGRYIELFEELTRGKRLVH